MGSSVSASLIVAVDFLTGLSLTDVFNGRDAFATFSEGQPRKRDGSLLLDCIARYKQQRASLNEACAGDKLARKVCRNSAGRLVLEWPVVRIKIS